MAARAPWRVALLAGTALAGVGFAPPARAQTALSAGTGAELAADLATVNANPSTAYTITITGPITLSAATPLPTIDTASTVTIVGQAGGTVLDGGSATRGFLVGAGAP
ncbi:MAG TPA: hypothetical protein VMU82_13830 [Acetobacteraceae bacterium]|nr:hypothetical protein [Acetobacteraceae bacterium]